MRAIWARVTPNPGVRWEIPARAANRQAACGRGLEGIARPPSPDLDSLNGEPARLNEQRRIAG
jgi:hypothetical protein